MQKYSRKKGEVKKNRYAIGMHGEKRGMQLVCTDILTGNKAVSEKGYCHFL